MVHYRVRCRVRCRVRFRVRARVRVMLFVEVCVRKEVDLLNGTVPGEQFR